MGFTHRDVDKRFNLYSCGSWVGVVYNRTMEGSVDVEKSVLEATRRQVEHEMDEYLRKQHGVDLSDSELRPQDDRRRWHYLGSPWLSKLPNPSIEGGRYLASLTDIMEITHEEYDRRSIEERKQKYPNLAFF